MRTLEFYRGTPVPEWLAKMSTPLIALSFVNDVTVVKNGPFCEVYVQNQDGGSAEDAFVFIDHRHWLRKFWDRLTRKEYFLDAPNLKKWVPRPFERVNDLGPKMKGGKYGAA